jgi:hypothetical protein
MTFNEKLNNFWIGLLIGVFFPMILFFFYWMFFHSQLSFSDRYFHYLLRGNLLSNVVKLCGLGNLVLFYYGLSNRLDSFNKGVILSVFLYLILIGYITYFLESKID